MEATHPSDSFRDTVYIVNKDGGRKWVFPKMPKGFFYKIRTLISYILLAIFFITPFIKINGHPIIKLNILEREFVLFGAPFWPQDFHLLFLAMICFFVFIILFTSIFGRVWCGYACPQTIFMELVFRKIDYWIEGDYQKKMKLAHQEWNTEKILKRVAKYGIYLIISLLISHTVMAYIIGLDEVIKIVQISPFQNLPGFIGIVVFTGIFFSVFAFLREVVCTVVCPYGRLQGVLMTSDTIQIAYDYIRGEPRGKIKKDEYEQHKGACIDCKLCVHVCPTGIDIRNGQQLECISCTACIDACDEVMVKINQPTGLIRYASEKNITEKTPFKITNRVKAYILVMCILLSVFSYLLVFRGQIEATFLRVPGMLYTEQPDGIINNMYNLQIINKTFHKKSITLKITSHRGKVKFMGLTNPVLQANEKIDAVVMVSIPKSEVHSVSNKIKIEVISDGEVLENVKSNFLAP